MIICPNCGKELDESCKFCSECGTRLQSEDTVMEANTDNTSDVSNYQPAPDPQPITDGSPAYPGPAAPQPMPQQQYYAPPNQPQPQQNGAYTLPNGINVINSGNPTFRVVCEYCLCQFEYHLNNLGYRAWYPHGFVYCPRCRKPLRHRNEYRIS
ncbi:MAG: zinc-ribbon domain-containing protein [Clostridia bacterium]|nr:zinc-ribbon domain-containing protein [Clostridia bacterium]